MRSPTPRAKTVARIVENVRPFLADQGPHNQGAALADLVAMWLAGHPPSIREDLLALHVELVRRLIPVNARIMGTEP